MLMLDVLLNSVVLLSNVVSLGMRSSNFTGLHLQSAQAVPSAKIGQLHAFANILYVHDLLGMRLVVYGIPFDYDLPPVDDEK
jgi:hypothetical protein